MAINKVWLTEQGGDVAVLSIESSAASPEYSRVHTTSMSFPAVPTPDKPLRHVVTLAMLDDNDLVILRNAIDEYLILKTEG